MAIPHAPEPDDGPPCPPPGAPPRAVTLARTLPPATPLALPFAEVLRRARALDHAALALLYQRHAPLVHRYIAARVRDTHLAEDLTSEVFVRTVAHIAQLRADDELTFAAWLLRIARNAVCGHFRMTRAQPPTGPVEHAGDALAAGAEAGDPLDVITAREEWSEVVVALRQLTEEQRQVLLYRALLGYSTDEVARLLGKRRGAIRALRFRALAALARLLDRPRA
ncbi:MAG TPA: RNA polymerase sigma factor [Ktedonobacterales bacterium]|nr:RNA polymerase sigma factor [Ktedonobacterales bacterium]